MTFDEWGVSHHTNHIQVHHGCMHLFNSKQFPGLDMYTLETVPLIRKYNSFLDTFFSSSQKVNYFLSSPVHAAAALMLHDSQFVWFRKLEITFGRYVLVNSLNYYSKELQGHAKSKDPSRTDDL